MSTLNISYFSATMLFALAALGLAGCDQPAPGATETKPFQFATVTDDTVDITVTSPKGPLRGVTLVMREEVPASAADAGSEAPVGDVLWKGITGPDGHVRDRLTRPAAATHVVLFAHAPGHQGPYDDEQVRKEAGAYAPAAWITIPISELNDYTLNLTSKAVIP